MMSDFSSLINSHCRHYRNLTRNLTSHHFTGEKRARADERCWLGGSFERALANFVNIAILNQIIFDQAITINLNVLDVYRN